MDKSIIRLFEFTRAAVTEQDIRDYSLSDPGYGAYVSTWSDILKSGEMPCKGNFELFEMISCVGGHQIEKIQGLGGLMAYRRFANAVAAGLVFVDEDRGLIFPENLALRLLEDVDEGDIQHLLILSEVFPSMRTALKGREGNVEYPFFTAGSLVVAMKMGESERVSEMARLLMADEAEARRAAGELWIAAWGNSFLYSLGLDGWSRKRWMAIFSGLESSNEDEDVQLVLDSLR